MQELLLDYPQRCWASFSDWWNENLVIFTRDDYLPLLDISGFLGILAFSVAVFTLSKPVYRFRQATAVMPFRRLFFWTIVFSGTATFALEALIMHGIRIPKFFNPTTINFLITLVIALEILYWMKICFIWPPKFSKLTARHFSEQTFFDISNGSKEDILATARELYREIPRLINLCPASNDFRRKDEEQEEPKWNETERVTYSLLGMLSDPRFCDLVAEEIPSFPARLVDQMVELKRPNVPVHSIVKRMVIALLSKPGSALFVENEWLAHGYMGEVKPITSCIFANWHKVEHFESGVDSPLDLGFPYAEEWDTETWRVYFGTARAYIDGLASNDIQNWDTRGIRYILQTTERAYKQIGVLERHGDPFDPRNPASHASEANDFLEYLVKQLDKAGQSVSFNRKYKYHYGSDISSGLAKLFSEAVYRASGVNTKDFLMWDVQHNLVWYALSNHEIRNTEIMKVTRRKLRRMIWREIAEMDRFPNYKGARYVRFCLNVLGFYEEEVHRNNSIEKDSWPLAKVVSNWVQVNYQTVAKTHPPVAKAMLPANIEYDAKAMTLVRTREHPLTGIPRKDVFKLDPARM